MRTHEDSETTVIIEGGTGPEPVPFSNDRLPVLIEAYLDGTIDREQGRELVAALNGDVGALDTFVQEVKFDNMLRACFLRSGSSRKRS